MFVILFLVCLAGILVIGTIIGYWLQQIHPKDTDEDLKTR